MSVEEPLAGSGGLPSVPAQPTPVTLAAVAAGEEATAMDDAAIPDIDDLDEEELMVNPPQGEEDDDANTLRPATIAADQATARQSTERPSGHSSAEAQQPQPHYLTAQEPEDNIVHTSHTPHTHTLRAHSAAHVPPPLCVCDC